MPADNAHSVQWPPPRQCDIRGCVAPSAAKWWSGDRSFYVELCEKHGGLLNRMSDIVGVGEA